MAGNFQGAVNLQPAPGIAGDFASADEYMSTLAGPGELVAGASGVNIGVFGWAKADGTVSNSNASTDGRFGFVARQIGLAQITAWLAQAGNSIQAGRELTLHSRGSFWAQTKTVATVGQKVFTSTTDGTISTGAAGATIAGSIELANWYVGSAGAANDLIKITTWMP